VRHGYGSDFEITNTNIIPFLKENRLIPFQNHNRIILMLDDNGIGFAATA
jgi:hypothetical protein